MLILSVDTSTRTGSAAVLRDAEVIAEISSYEETPYSSRLFRDVDLLQSRAKFRLSEIDLFAVASGPGSFTGLRVGLTAVKGWAEVHRKPVAAISGLEAIASEAIDLEGEELPGFAIYAPFLDARRGQIFGAMYRFASEDGGRLHLTSDESILSMTEFAEMLSSVKAHPVALVSPTPEILPAPMLGNLPAKNVIRVSAALAPAIGKLGFKRFQRCELVDSLRLDANYVRRSDAEAAWKDE